MAAAPDIGPAAIHRIAPREFSLHGTRALGEDGPACGFDPFGIGRQALAGPARVRGCLVPRDADDRMVVLAVREDPVFPIARAGLAGAIDEPKYGGPNRLVPELHLFVAAVFDEFEVVAVGDGEAVEEQAFDVDQSLGTPGFFFVE